MTIKDKPYTIESEKFIHLIPYGDKEPEHIAFGLMCPCGPEHSLEAYNIIIHRPLTVN